MYQSGWQVTNTRFNMADPSIYIVCGLWPKGEDGYAVLNNEKLDIKVEEHTISGIKDKPEGLETVAVSVKLPKALPQSGELQIYVGEGGEKNKWFSESVDEIRKKDVNPQIFVEQIKRFNSRHVVLAGWAASTSKVNFEAYSEKGEPLSGQVVRFPRPDVQAEYAECDVDKHCGFQLAYRDFDASEINIVFKSEAGEVKLNIPMKGAKVLYREIRDDFVKGVRFIRNKGLKAACKRVVSKIKRTDRPVEYSRWIRYNFPNNEELNKQRQEKFDYSPLISIVVPLYKTKEVFLDALVDSVKAQSYTNWELCLSDGSGAPTPLASKLKRLAAEDKRINVIPADKPYRIVENTNRAIENAHGEFIAFADHDDVLAPNALYEVVKALNKDPEIEMLYSDEDKINASGKYYFEPHMKPDFNIDLLRTVNYICHLCVMKKTLLDRIGYLNNEYEGAQDYDIVLRASENTKHIYHIPKVLYHWRSHAASTAENPESKEYAFDSGRRAIQAHFDRLGIKAEVFNGEFPGLYRTKYIRDYDPLVSIVIPNKDHIDDLDRCIRSICRKSTYSNYEFVIVENNSEDKKTFEYYKKLEAENPKVRVVYYGDKFNYSLINNFGVQHAKGEYLWLLNNDTSVINDNIIEELLGYCMRDDVGIVGARLFFEDDTVQHAGVVVGFGGIAGHCFVNQPRNTTGYYHRIICAQDYSAVTAACMMVDRHVYEEVGGFSKELAVAFNDIDFCLKVREKGYLVVYNPYAMMHHYESKSRGYEDTPEKIMRFQQEINTFAERWPEILENGDPYYNPNLTLESQDFSLRKNF